jgi:glycosyltransferase involved in cell wall biosynthesis
MLNGIAEMQRVSVIIPVYSQATCLKDALNSILEHILTDWKCIIVNDGSMDNSEKIAFKWEWLEEKRYQKILI